MFNRLNEIIILLSLMQCAFSYFAVYQCPGTEVPNIRHQTNYNDVSLIFYYTRWDDESLKALQHFNDVAAVLGDQVYFATVDCWHLACNCSNSLSTAMGSGYPHKWPTLVVHYGRTGKLNLQYNGLFTFRNIFNFVMNIMYPLERIKGKEDLEKIMSSADGVVLGAFQNPRSSQYKAYLAAAVKWLEHDPVRSYRFFVTFTNAKESYNKTDIKQPNLLLLGHKSKKSFADYIFFKWNSSFILRWLHEELNDEYSTLRGYSTPITIAQKMKTQPVLAVFVNEPQKFFSYMEKYVDKEKSFSKTLISCQANKQRKAKRSTWTESSETCNNMFLKNQPQSCYYQTDMIRNLEFYYEINQHLEHLSQTSFVKKVNLEMYGLLDFYQSTTCLQKEDMTLETSLHISVVKRLEDYLANEQQCKSSNRSLSVVLLDAERYKDYLENLNIATSYQSMATVFIADNEKENVYIMEDRFAMFNLMEFVKKFYSNGLINYSKSKKTTSPSSRGYDTELKEVNRDIFLKYLQYTHNQTIVALIYSPECALCGNIQHSFMQLSLLLRSVLYLRFIRINVMDNDLPWQFNMPFLPALLVFPENRFSESRLFPTHLKPDIRNVLGFILNQLPAGQQVKLVLAMCQSGTLPKSHAPSCWQFAKTILMQHIGKHLQYWQIFDAERSLIFERLRAFKDLSLDIQSNLRL